MRKIVIWGCGSAWIKIKKMLNNKAKIVAFVDQYKKDYKDGVKIYSPDNLRRLDYDYIIIASQYGKQIREKLIDLDINMDIVIDLYELNLRIEYIKLKREYFKRRLEQSIKSLKINTIVTGMSYARWGIDEEMLSDKILNLSMDSSDLYVNYLTVKKSLNIEN